MIEFQHGQRDIVIPQVDVLCDQYFLANPTTLEPWLRKDADTRMHFFLGDPDLATMFFELISLFSNGLVGIRVSKQPVHAVTGSRPLVWWRSMRRMRLKVVQGHRSQLIRGNSIFTLSWSFAEWTKL